MERFFERLSVRQRADVVNSRGSYIASSIFNNKKVKLFSLYDFFVEVFYDEANKIEKISIISDEEILKYL